MSSPPPPPPAVNPTTMDSPSPPPSHRRLPNSFRTQLDSATLTPPPSRKNSPFSPSPLHLSIHASAVAPLRDLLLLSPSPHRRPRPRPATTDDALEPLAALTPRRKGKTRASMAAAPTGCTSPRNGRRARRRLEKDTAREERESGAFEDDAVARPRKRRQSKSKAGHKEKLGLVAASAPSSSSPLPEITVDDESCATDGLWELVSELVMWKNVAKSTLWFGLGSIFFLSSSLSRDLSFSIISVIAHLGILILVIAFFYDSFPESQRKMWRRDFRLTEADVLRAARVVLPAANAALAKAQDVFSGEPMMTLKVAPVLLFTAKYGHLITLWRLLATGFFMSFTIPKLYSWYSPRIHKGVENMRNHIWEAWKSCLHKRIVAASAATVFWNLCNARTRIIAAFLSLVILRYHHQQNMVKEEDAETERSQQDEHQQAIVLAE